MEYNVVDINTKSLIYPNDPAHIEPTWQPKPRSCNLINNIPHTKLITRGTTQHSDVLRCQYGNG